LSKKPPEVRVLNIEEEIEIPKEDIRLRYDEKEVERLAKSIYSYGLQHPIVVRPKGKKFEVISGVHRILAYEKLGRKYIPVIVKEDVDNTTALILRIHENTRRVQLNPFEVAELAKRLHEEKKTPIEELSKVLGVSRRHIYNCMELNKYLGREEKQWVIEGSMSVSEALRLTRSRLRKERQKELTARYEKGEPIEELKREGLKTTVCMKCGKEDITTNFKLYRLCFGCLSKITEGKGRIG